MANFVPLYIALMLAGAVWRYRQRDTIGMVACLLMAVLAVVVMVLPD